VAGGAAFAMAVLVRTTNALLLPALIVFLDFDARRLGLAVLGGLPGALWQGYYNHALYGGAFRSGYIDISEQFSWTYAAPTLLHFGKWLALLLPAAVLALPLAALARREGRARTLTGLTLWFAGFVGFYLFYEVSHEVWWDLRFILPGTPALILAGLLGLAAFARSRPPAFVQKYRVIAASILSLSAAGLGWFWTARFHVLMTPAYERAYADASAAARMHFAANAVVIAGLHSGALYYYTDFPVLRWEFLNPREFERFRALAEKARRPMHALLFAMEEPEALRNHCPGDWTRIATVQNISLWRLDGPIVASAPR
jgi:hypothetical protein